jgi:hypothetical protein
VAARTMRTGGGARSRAPGAGASAAGSVRARGRAAAAGAGQLVLRADDASALDLLDASAMRAAVGVDAGTQAAIDRRRAAAAAGGAVSGMHGLRFGADGRLIVGGDGGGEQGWGLKRIAHTSTARSGGGAGGGTAHTGEAYRSRKAGGDVQPRGGAGVEPYAYVPLDARSMSGGGGGAAVDRFAAVVASTSKSGRHAAKAQRAAHGPAGGRGGNGSGGGSGGSKVLGKRKRGGQ